MRKINGSINILRYISSIFIALQHYCYIVGNEPYTIFGVNIGNIGLAIVMMLSGYCSLKSLNSSKSTIAFYKKRIKKIFPTLLICIILTVFVLGKAFSGLNAVDYYTNTRTWTYFTNCFLYMQYDLPGVFVNNNYPNVINGSLWTLPIQFVLYLMIPLIFTKNRKKNIYISVGTCSIFTILYFALARNNVTFVLYNTNIVDAFRLSIYFLMGCIYYLLDDRKFINLKYILALVLLMGICKNSYLFEMFNYKEIVFFLFLSYIVFSIVNINFECPICEKDYSYNIYIFHFPLMQMMYVILNDSSIGNSFIIFLIPITIIIILSVMVDYIKNIIKRKKHTGLLLQELLIYQILEIIYFQLFLKTKLKKEQAR